MVLPESMRLKGYRCFNYLHRAGIRHQSPSMLLRVVKARPELLKPSSRNCEKKTIRVAVTISSKVSKRAVIRNRLRRLIHDHLKSRLSSPKSYQNKWALLTLKPICSKTDLPPLLQECDRLLNEAGLLL